MIEVRTHTDAVETLTALGEYALKHRTNHLRTPPHSFREGRSQYLFGTVDLLLSWLLESRTFFWKIVCGTCLRR